MQPSKTLLSICVAAITLLLAACGGSGTTGPGEPNPSGSLGPGMPAAAPDDFEIVGDEMKSASWSFNKFFLDSVNHQSAGRWTVLNYSGAKQFTLSNTYFTEPKAWVIGQNYWNREEDELWTNGFTIPAVTHGLRLSFYARWSIANGDSAAVFLDDGSTLQPVTTFPDGQNPDYPGWTKYYFELPDNDTLSSQTWSIGFTFESDTSGTDWGLGIDSVAVYQTRLNPPINVVATDGDTGSITIDWDHNNAGTLEPELYLIYRAIDSGGSPGPYSFYTSVSYPASAFTDDSVVGGLVYWYKLTSNKTGYPDSSDSNEDSGEAL